MDDRRSGEWRLAALAGCAMALACAPATAREACRPPPESPAMTVRAAPDAMTLLLVDGRTVRLADIEAPAAAAPATADPIASKAHEFLRIKAVGGRVRLRPAPETADRHGRLRAYVFLDHSPDAGLLERSLQQAMVDMGFARVAARIGDADCAGLLRSGEVAARKARIGLWGDARYTVLRADDPAALRRMRGRFVLVEGRVLSVRESGGTVYLNFGRRWSEDFTVTVARRHLRQLAAGGLDPKRLERRTVRVRGWVEERGGPWIELTRPEQFEVVEN